MRRQAKNRHFAACFSLSKSCGAEWENLGGFEACYGVSENKWMRGEVIVALAAGAEVIEDALFGDLIGILAD
jgi:hypothetical protein